ncbi:nucleoside hydrolase [Herbiconiux daphne]|uniref:Nucleoside hydrolase n=1 Tax=Herbiconiux daphne TaxID=2970914 RepID=A0ABT2H355_9MICO|nr:nucleoside hydrolase [Herbiconiux daphne]MCS5734371.1 nucleoside hydrolase [Herbiconiux daphne]
MPPEKVVIDTDIGYLNDDSIALGVALGSPELEVLAVTVVAGNFSVQQGVTDGLAMLERFGRLDIPLHAGAAQPLVHRRSAYADASWGRWGTDDAAPPPLGRPARATSSALGAAEAVVALARQFPGELSIIALGPLTTVAEALALEPRLASLLKRIVIMGGSVAAFPHGAGNITPTAEFNVWVDPEAAGRVLSSGAAMELVPLNATRLVAYTAGFHADLQATGGLGAEILAERMGDFFTEASGDLQTANFSNYGLCDSTAVIAAVRPAALDWRVLQVQVDLSAGPAYGTSYCYLLSDPALAKVQNAEGVWDGLHQPLPLTGAVSPPATVRVAIAADGAAVRAECLTRLAALRA